MTLPKASESGMFLRGSFTSPAVNVMLFHASGGEQRSGLRLRRLRRTGLTPIRRVRPGVLSMAPRAAHRLPKLSGDRHIDSSRSQSDRITRAARRFRRREDVLMILP